MADAEKKAQKAKADATEGEGEKKKSKLMLIFVAAAVLLAGGGAAFYFFSSGKEAVKEAPPSLDEASEHSEKVEPTAHANTEAEASEKKDKKGADEKNEDGKNEKKDGENGEHKAGSDKEAKAKAEALLKINFGSTYNLKPFHLNLGNPLENRYVRLEVALEFKQGPEQEQEITARLPQLRDAIISVASRKTREFLLGPDGKDQLRLEILNRVNQYMDKKIESVFITDMLIE